MKFEPFKLERYFAKYEFSAPYLLSSSDCEPLTLTELLALANPDSLARWDQLSLGYTESQGDPSLREAIAGLYREIAPGQVLVLSPEEGILIAMQAILEPGDHVICTYPGYQSLYEIARSLGCEVTFWKPEYQQGWHFDPAFLENAVQANTKLIVVNFPHNPTGATLSPEEFRSVLELAERGGITVFSDEMYRLLEYAETQRLPYACDVYANAVSLFGMSKSFGLAGLRIGWLATQNAALLQKFVALKDYTTICSSAPSEILALIALRAQAQIIARNLDIIQANLSTLAAFFTRHAETFEWHAPTAGPIAFPRLRLPVEIDAFCKKLVEQQGVMLLPASVYDYPIAKIKGFFANHFRLGFGHANLEPGLERLESFLAARAWK
ncbi:MAG: aminotransferase class I/II-fold pyridoxal phosphate-dependent enzyme [Anaerolineales bacterium]|nr:aminotransferase class I/II-fold pyridoxal phosphate-dependent enzyme [Anaerolineales bacterium]